MRLSILRTTTAIALSLACACPVFAQNYHYNYGSSRVVNQGSTGLMHSESTYIPTGAMNPTAKGVVTGGVGQISNPLLPKVPWGAHINTPGDNFYMGGAPDRKKAVMPEYMYPQIYQAKMAARERKRKQQENKRQAGEIYYPGQNSGAANNSGGVQTQYTGGAATYAEAATTQKKGY